MSIAPIERVPLDGDAYPYKHPPDCPWPGDDALHRPWCREIKGHACNASWGLHQHRPKVGMGGKNPDARIVAVICPSMSQAVDNHMLADGKHYVDSDGKDGHYRIFVSEGGRMRPVLDREIPGGIDGLHAAAGKDVPELQEEGDVDGVLVEERATGGLLHEARLRRTSDLEAHREHDELGGPSAGDEAEAVNVAVSISSLAPGSDWLTRWRNICDSGNRLRRAVNDWHWAMAIVFLEGDDDKYQYADECGLSESRLQQVVHTVECWRDAPEALTSAATISQLERLTPMRRERPQEAAETLRRCIDEGLTDKDMRTLLAPPREDTGQTVCEACGQVIR